MLIAYRSGGAEELIPLAFRERYARAGYRFREAPAGLAEVSAPTPLSQARLVAEVPAAPSVVISEAGSDSSPEPASSPLGKKRGRR